MDGSKWPSAFVAALELPEIFAGLGSREKSKDYLDVQPRKAPPKLVKFQDDLKIRMLEVLKREGDKTRCMVTLPTGGGKTRVAVEAFVDWMQPRFAQGKYLLWIAQSEELCEQALMCIVQMWSAREFVDPLRVYRFFGNHDLNLEDLIGGAVVANIQKLHSRIKKDDEVALELIKNTGAMVIDEAHRATSMMYDSLLENAAALCGPDMFPICGLSATPGRAGGGGLSQTPKLVGRFETYLLKPQLGEEYEERPLRYFRDHGYISRAQHTVASVDCEITLTDDEAERFERDQELPLGFLKRLASDETRNKLILTKLLARPKCSKTLVYACTVEHAYLLAELLESMGRRAAAISAETPAPLRRALIEEFKKESLEFLCNYEVLSTGFDAPKTDCIALCRPTTSEILYEQIIGRGLRGPQFGGTANCEIIDFADNIRRLGAPLAYTRFAEYWE